MILSAFIILLKTHKIYHADQLLLPAISSSNVIISIGILVNGTLQMLSAIFNSISRMLKFLPMVWKKLNSYKDGFHSFRTQFGFQLHSRILTIALALYVTLNMVEIVRDVKSMN